MKRQQATGNGQLFFMTAVLAGAMLISGCGAVTDKSAAAFANSESVATEAYEADNGFSMDSSYDYEAEESGDYEYSETSGQEDRQLSDSSRKLIRTVEMFLETKDFSGLLLYLEEEVSNVGGYIEYQQVYNGSSYDGTRALRSADLTLRIPKAILDDFLKHVESAANITSRQENVEDVTLKYVDMESRREALKVEQQRLLELLEKAETVTDIITIESRLSSVRYEIESMESQLRTFDNQVDYSTVSLYISEVEVLTPVEEETAWERITRGFAENVKNIVSGLKEFCIGFIICLPYILEWGIIIAVVCFCCILLVRRRKKKKAKKAAAAEREKEKTDESKL